MDDVPRLGKPQESDDEPSGSSGVHLAITWTLRLAVVLGGLGGLVTFLDYLSQ